MECFDGGSPKHNQLGGLLPFFKCAKNTVRYLGVACSPRDGTTYAELFNKADKATYAAKKLGRNRCVFYKEMNGDAEQGDPLQ